MSNWSSQRDVALTAITTARIAIEAEYKLVDEVRSKYGVTETADILGAISLAFIDAEEEMLAEHQRHDPPKGGWGDTLVEFETVIESCVEAGLRAALPGPTWTRAQPAPQWEIPLYGAVAQTFWFVVRGLD